MLRKMISPPHWEMILEKIHEGRCVPFLGAGVNAKTQDYEGLLLGSGVALRLLERLLGLEIDDAEDLGKLISFHTLEHYRQRKEEAAEKIRGLVEALRQDCKRELEAAAEAALAIEDQEGRKKALAEKVDATFRAAGDNYEKTLREALAEILPDKDDRILAHIVTPQVLWEHKELVRLAVQDLARVSLRYLWETREVDRFIGILKGILPDAQLAPSKILMTLAELPLKLIVTTNYDRLMERALELFALKNVRAQELFQRLKEDLNEPAAPLSRCLGELLSDATRRLLLDEGGPPPAPEELGPILIADLNRLIQEKSLYRLVKVSEGEKLEEVRKEVDERPLSYLDVRRNRQYLEGAYKDSITPSEPYVVIVQPKRGFEGRELVNTKELLATHDGVVLYKFHGSFSDDSDEDKRPLITEEDYIEFLTYVGGQGQSIDSVILTQIKSSSFLFLGYGLEDWNFRALFKGLIEKVDDRHHSTLFEGSGRQEPQAADEQKKKEERLLSFAIQKDPSPFWVDFWDRKNVVIYDMDLYEFAAQLKSKYEAYALKNPKPAKPLKAAQPERKYGRGAI